MPRSGPGSKIKHKGETQYMLLVPITQQKGMKLVAAWGASLPACRTSGLPVWALPCTCALRPTGSAPLAVALPPQRHTRHAGSSPPGAMPPGSSGKNSRAQRSYIVHQRPRRIDLPRAQCAPPHPPTLQLCTPRPAGREPASTTRGTRTRVQKKRPSSTKGGGRTVKGDQRRGRQHAPCGHSKW
jgi:hypothetical protein